MSRYVYEAYTRVWWVVSISSIAAPTEAEITAGTDITSYITKNGLSTPQNQNNVDSATIAETFDAQIPGSWGGQIDLTCFRDNDGTDAAWALFVYGTAGHIVIRRGVAVATAHASSQKVEVYPVTMHQPIMQPSAANEQTRFTVALPVSGTPNLKATIAS